MAEHGKKYVAAAKQVDEKKNYNLDEAITLLKQTNYVKFDSTIELHFRLGIDPRHADQQIRTTATLPHGTGKPIRILVFTQGEGETLARNAGADFVGSDELISRIEKENWMDFDVAIATPEQMGKVGRLGKILGRRGLMPNPKSGTIAQPNDLPRVIQEVRRGKVEFRNDKTGLVHVGLGKLSFSEDQIRDNALSLIEAIVRNKPSGAKGTYVRSITLTSTMGVGIHLDVNPTLAQVS